MTTSLQLTYGGLLLGVTAQQIGLPVPSVVFLMAAGALSAQGGMRASIIVCLGVIGCLAGDGLWFWIGRKWGSKAVRVLCRFTPDPRHCSRNAREKFHRYGLPVLLVNKFLPGLDAVMPPLSGAEGVSLTTFLSLDTVGSLLWSGAYVALGYVFSKELDVAIGWVKHCGTVLGAAIAVPLVLYAGWRGLVLLRMIRRLRLRRISPPMLARKLKSDRNIAVIDLSNFEDEPDGKSPAGIPGAFTLDPSVLRKSPHISVPKKLKLILYSSSGSDTVCAWSQRRALIRTRVWVPRFQSRYSSLPIH